MARYDIFLDWLAVSIPMTVLGGLQSDFTTAVVPSRRLRFNTDDGIRRAAIRFSGRETLFACEFQYR